MYIHVICIICCFPGSKVDGHFPALEKMTLPLWLLLKFAMLGALFGASWHPLLVFLSLGQSAGPERRRVRSDWSKAGTGLPGRAPAR